MKKMTIAFGSLFVLAACSFPTPLPSNNLPPLTLSGDYGVKTAAAASLLTDAIGGQYSPLSGPRNQRLTESEEQEAIEKVQTYLGMMNQLLAEHPIQTELVESDREGFDYKSIITTIGLDGVSSVFVLYFNGVIEEEIPTSSSEVTSSEVSSEPSSVTSESMSLTPLALPQRSSVEDDQEDIDHEYETEDGVEADLDDEDKDDYQDHHNHELGEETEEGDVTSLSGLAIVGDLEYQLLGFTKTEGDEVKTKYFLSLDQDNWIKIDSKTEENSSKYHIVMKANGEFSKMSFKIESEIEGSTQIKLFIKSENNAPEMFKFKRDFDLETNTERIRIDARLGREKFKAVVYISTDENGDVVYTYRFEGSNRDHERGGDRDYHDHHNH